MDEDEGYYYTGQTPFRKPNESKLHYHARRLVAIQTLARLEYSVEEAESRFNRSLGPVELTFVGLGMMIPSLSIFFHFVSLPTIPTTVFFAPSKESDPPPCCQLQLAKGIKRIRQLTTVTKEQRNKEGEQASGYRLYPCMQQPCSRTATTLFQNSNQDGRCAGRRKELEHKPPLETTLFGVTTTIITPN